MSAIIWLGWTDEASTYILEEKKLIKQRHEDKYENTVRTFFSGVNSSSQHDNPGPPKQQVNSFDTVLCDLLSVQDMGARSNGNFSQ